MPDLEIHHFLSSSLAWLSGYLKWTIITDLNIPLVAGQMEYQIPKTHLYHVWTELGGRLLVPTSTWALNSGASTTTAPGTGLDWRQTPPGLPTRYAIEDREMILSPPPDAATVSTTPVMVWRYMGTGTEWGEQSEVGMGAMGLPALSDLDEDLVRYDAAMAYLAAHPSDVNDKRYQAYAEEIKRRLPEAKRRWELRIADYLPTERPDTSGRFYAAR